MDTNCEIVWDSYTACAYAEGFCEGEGATLVEQLHAWAYIHKTQMWKNLQGWYGKTVHDLVRAGIINDDSSINWDIAESKMQG